MVQIASSLASELREGDRVILEGEMGVGKSTFAKALLHALGITQPPEGSPSFAIAHEYHCSRGDVIHLDLYRLKSEEELEDAGVNAYYWERRAMVLSEWLSLFDDFFQAVVEKSVDRVWKVDLDWDGPMNRKIKITRFN
jgi:tRNA threonylcarbamoyl adenosine modification protein YjeE